MKNKTMYEKGTFKKIVKDEYGFNMAGNMGAIIFSVFLLVSLYFGDLEFFFTVFILGFIAGVSVTCYVVHSLTRKVTYRRLKNEK